MANRIKSIGAKTVHKKSNFHTPNVRLNFTEDKKDTFGLNAYARELAKGLEEKLNEGNNIKTPNAKSLMKVIVLDSKNESSLKEFKQHLASLTNYMIDNGYNISPLPKIKFIHNNIENANNMLGVTAYYNPNNKSITLFTLNRHPKDILRSYAHEMIHHKQNLENRLTDISGQNINEDDYLKEIEREAYEEGNMMFRSWENSLNKK
jgi:hypothetical protein